MTAGLVFRSATAYGSSGVPQYALRDRFCRERNGGYRRPSSNTKRKFRRRSPDGDTLYGLIVRSAVVLNYFHFSLLREASLH